MPDLTDMFYVTVIGVSVVFALLIVLMYIVVFQSKVIAFIGKKRQKKNENSTLETAERSNEDELIVVLTAAITSVLNIEASAPKIRVTSFRRIGSDTPVWNYAARRQNIQ